MSFGDKTTMALLEFLRFPFDIKTFILSYVSNFRPTNGFFAIDLKPQIKRQTDLRSLCLVSHELRTLTTPSLYRRVALTVGGDRDLLLSAMLRRDNPGLVHIREISIFLMRNNSSMRHRQYDEPDSSEDEQGCEWGYSISARQAHFVVRLLLDLLPADILDIFRYVRNSSGLWQSLSVKPIKQALSVVLKTLVHGMGRNRIL